MRPVEGTVRTQRALLPRHYHSGLIYYRRPPRLPQQYLTDSHLLVMRGLMLQPATVKELQQRCGMGDERMARELAALYFVGTVTSNAKRAAPAAARPADSESSGPSNLNLDSLAPAEVQPRSPQPDLTAPAPLRPDH